MDWLMTGAGIVAFVVSHADHVASVLAAAGALQAAPAHRTGRT